MRLLVVAAAYTVSLAAVAIVAFFVVIFLAGPHAGLLPMWLEAVVLACGWLAVLIVPVLVTRRVWHRLGQRSAPAEGN